jgi:hypothetical protein
MKPSIPSEYYYTPGEVSAVLAEHGITLHPKMVRERCALPASDPQHIRTNAAFPGRHYIPFSEVNRLIADNIKTHE